MKIIKGMIIIGMVFGCQTAYAANLTIPNTFVSGAPAVAADVNANFAAAATAVNDIEARLAALEAVTSTNLAVTPMQKIAGTWGYMINALWGGQFVPNLVDIGREVAYGTVVIRADGTFTLNEVGGHGVGFGLHNNLVLQTTILPKADGTTNTIATAQVVDQKAIITNDVVPALSVTGTISIGVGNFVTMKKTPAQAPVWRGYVSQNGQVIMLQGTPTAGSTLAGESNILTLTKIQ